ncbi:MAG: hypothetical protein Hens3KO_11540 [Henriciella sp.]
MTSRWKQSLMGVFVSVLLSMFWVSHMPRAYAALGDEITNIAKVSQAVPNGRLELYTNPASFTVEARPTVSQIDFFRIAPAAPDAITAALNGSDYSPTGSASDAMNPIADAYLADAPIPALGASVDLVPAETYVPGETIVVRVIDAGQNGDPDAIETVIITVQCNHGDAITLRLYESGPNTGEFFAYFLSSSAPTAQNDAFISAPKDTVLTATYIDAFDAAEVSIDTALVDPYGRIFDSFTGELLDGALVTIVYADTGQPADVFGIDAVSAYPSTLTTGSPVTDASGRVYELSPGEFLFPLMAPGDYRLEISAPEGYFYPSVRGETDFETLLNAPFEIIAGSYGASFTVTASGPLNLDVPLDPGGDLIVRKSAETANASIGDFIGYTVNLENAGDIPAPFRLQDTLPKGLRYVSGTARLNQVEIADPTIAADGRSLLFAASAVLPGETVTLTYLTSVGPGTPEGDIVNTAVAVNGNGEALSNIAEAAVTIEEDLLQSRMVIIGRVVEAACTPDDDWARPLRDGTGIAGVRLYMESGRYVVTDVNGLYHFEGVEPGTHVVQVDEATLPQGYDPVICEENSRYAGSALSKFVDAQGGTLWRANFYLKRNGEALEAEESQTKRVRSADRFDQAWLDTQTDARPRWVYPATGDTPDGRSVSLGIAHGPRQRAALRLNGHPVSGLNFAGLDRSVSLNVAMSRWTGIDIQRGANTLTADILDTDGTIVSQLNRTIWFVDEVQRATLIADRSITIADGRTKPVIAIRLEDEAGHPIHKGRIANISVAAPYRLAQTAEQEFQAPVASAYSAVSGTRVAENGIAYVELEPTLQTGRVRLQVETHDGRQEEVDIWLQPEKREWVVVGLAEAEGLLLDQSGESDGRVALFAKGLIKGEWLLTVAIDTAKRRSAQDGELFDEIDPNAYYTLYGDQTWQSNDAESRYPVYVKLERDTVQFLFGDYSTDLTDTQLGRYARQLSGLKAEIETGNLSVTAFAAESNQTFTKDELAADGTSGPFTLSRAPLIRSSEMITIETRDRFRPDTVTAIRALNRYIDYDIDYVTGELFFRHPISATDTGLNPNVIVIDYETSQTGERNLTAGGRVSGQGANGLIEAGVSAIVENDNSNLQSGASNLIAVDVTLTPNEQTEIRVEAARSDVDTGTDHIEGDAWLVEAAHRTEQVSLLGYYREESANFGLGQQASSTSALRRIGVQLSAELGIKDLTENKDRLTRRVEAQAYREENLDTHSRRDVADLSLRSESQAFTSSFGVRAVSEDYEAEADPRQSVLLTGQVSKTFLDHGLTISAAHEEPVWGGGNNDDEATLFPGRSLLGVDKTLGRQANLSIRHEITNGSDSSGDSTIAGINWTPWTGGQMRAATDMVTTDSARRIGATVGVDQSWQLNQQWSLSSGLARRANIEGDEIPLDVAADDADSPLEPGFESALVDPDNAYTSGYFGIGYRGDKSAVSGRVELRDSALGDRLLATLGGAREVSEALSFSARGRYQTETLEQSADTHSLDVRIGAAWRPRGEGTVLFNRFDVGHEKVEGETLRTKAVNNLALNTMLSDRTQASFYHGIKYVETDFFGAEASGFTHLIGGEVRHDITPKIDLGLHGFWTSGEVSKTAAWAAGPSVGFTPKNNIWVSLGWNFEGFEDQDFSAAEYTRSGPYIKLRAKFDRDTVTGLIDRLGLGSD